MENLCTSCSQNGHCTAFTGLCLAELAADFGTDEARQFEARPTREEGWICDCCGKPQSKDSLDCPTCTQ